MNNKQQKVGFISLGCPKNRVDSEMAIGDLTSKGYLLTNNEQEADVLVINTCGFIEAAREESINTIVEMAEYKKSGQCKHLIVMGCLTQKHKEELLKEIPEIDYVTGAGDFSEIAEMIASANPQRDHVKSPGLDFNYNVKRVLTTHSHSAYLKISEGCSNVCSFCAIPQIRGPFQSVPMPSIIEEANRLAESGVKEINLVAQDTTMYGADLSKKEALPLLIQELSAIEKIEWIRLLYCYPSLMNDTMIDMFNESEKLCKYIDLPLQHSHDTILKAMLREEREGAIRKTLEKIRKKIPEIAIRTAFIVGFPGETDQHFESLYNFVNDMRFDHLGAFTYSKEEDTISSTLEGHLPEEVKLERKERIMELQKEISLEKNQDLVGTVQKVLVDGNTAEDQFLFSGRTEKQAPEIDGLVYLEKSEVYPGDFVDVEITKGLEYDLIGEVIER